jgi:hypothetical protein
MYGTMLLQKEQERRNSLLNTGNIEKLEEIEEKE